MKKILFVLFTCIVTQVAMAQSPKWVEKAKRAVFSIITYDGDDKILNTGNGFFVTENGIALSDYSIFKNAQRAVIVNCDGKQMNVESILGANEMYDVIKFQVAITEKKVQNLTIASIGPEIGAEVYLLPYSTQKDKSCTQGKVKELSKIGEKYNYYTIDLMLKDKMVSCPITTADGAVLGIAQKATGKDTTDICYAAGAAFAMSQTISGLSLNDRSLQNLGIKMGLPDTEEQALIFLFLASSQLSPEAYIILLNDFIKQYPNSPEGYMRRAAALTYNNADEASFQKSANDFNQALKVATQKDEVYYSLAKHIYSYQLSQPEETLNGWTYDKALENTYSALAVDSLPIYMQLVGDIMFAKRAYPEAYVWYDKVNKSNLVSSATYFNAAKTKEFMGAEPKEVIALLDSCIAISPQPMTVVNAPYLLERAQMYMNDEQYRAAMVDYDAYYEIVNGQVNDLFYYYREQAAFKARQYQRALDDIAKAIELNPAELTYQAEQAVVNMRVGRLEQAIDVLKKISQQDPDYAEAYRLLGICQIQQKNKEAACANFQKAKELGDTNVDELIQKHCK